MVAKDTRYVNVYIFFPAHWLNVQILLFLEVALFETQWRQWNELSFNLFFVIVLKI